MPIPKTHSPKRNRPDSPPENPIDWPSGKMKIKNLKYVASVCTLMIGIGILGLVEIRTKPEVPRHDRQHQIVQPDSERSVSISKGTSLALLAMGIIGVLCVRHKNKAPKKPAQHTAPQTASEDRDKVFIDLNKQYLNLQYKITQHKFSGDTLPDCLLREISDIERKLRLISRALE